MLDRLDHVILAVTDLDAAARAYMSLLGRRPSWRGEHPALGTANVLFRLDNMYLELLSPVGEGAVADGLRARLASEGEGVAGLAFGTPDAQACYRMFQERALEPSEPQPGLGRDSESGAFREWTNVHLPLSRTRGVLLFAIEQRSPDDLLPEATPAGDPAASVAALDHVVLMSEDPDATRALYKDGLGLRLALDKEFPKWGARQLFFRIGGATVEVGAKLGGDPRPEARDRLWGLAWAVHDATAAHARLAPDFQLDALRAGRKPGSRVFTVKSGTCGVPTLVIQQPPRDA